MAVVTGIVASPRRAGRFDLQIDGQNYGAVSLELVERLKLAVGATVDDSVDGTLAREVATLATYDRALNMLASQPRSSRDLRRRLLARKEAPAVVDVVIARLEASGALDDAAFARQFARSRVVGAGHSRRRVQQELYKRGVARDAIDGAVDEVFVDEQIDESELVDEAARKKLRTLERLDPAVRRRRLYAYLARRGYDTDSIRLAMDRLLSGSGESSAGDDLGEY